MATTLYLGGRVLVCDGVTPAGEALVVRDGRVAGVGARDAMARLAGRDAETVDVRGATILPGLVDTHPHVMHFGAFAEPLVDIADARSHDEIVARIRECAATTPPGDWIMTTPVGEPHYFIRRSWRDLAEGRLPDRHVLDRAAPHHPVLIQSWAPVIPNVCALNGLALERLRITRDSPDQVEHVWIEKDAQGEPTGILRGAVNNYYTNDAFMNALLREIPLLQPDAVLPGTVRAMATYNRLGVTTVYEGHAMGPGEIGVWRMLREQGALTLRVLTALEAESYGLPWTHPLSMGEFRDHLEAALAMEETSDDLLRHHGVTLSRGGPCWPGFLRMWEPYRDPWGEPTTGVEFVEPEKEQVALDFCAERRLRLNFIGAGYRDHDEFLDRAEAVARRIPIADRGCDPAARVLPHRTGRPPVRGARHARHHQHVVLLGQGRPLRRADRRPRAARPDPAAPHARCRAGGRLRQRLGPEKRLRARRARGVARLRGQRSAQRRPGAAGHAGGGAVHVDPGRRPGTRLGRDRNTVAWQPRRPDRRRPRSVALLAGRPARDAGAADRAGRARRVGHRRAVKRLRPAVVPAACRGRARR